MGKAKRTESMAESRELIDGRGRVREGRERGLRERAGERTNSERDV
jgi:hypothetical protein